MLTIFTLLSVAQGIAGETIGQSLVGMHTHVHWFATPENKWMELLGKYLPRDLLVSDPVAMRAFYGGDSSLLRAGHLSLWARPFAFWFVAAMGMTWVSLCLVSLLRRRWIEHEKLAFPLAQAPLIMTDEEGKIYRNSAFWWAFGLVALYNTLRILHYFVPAFPLIDNRYQIELSEASRPWDAVGTVWFWFRPNVITMAFYMPLDLAFSAWFFWFAVNVQLVVRSLLGYGRPPRGRINQQSVAVWVALVGVVLWRARSTLAGYWQVAFSREKDEQEDQEAMSYRAVFLGLLGGIVLLTAFAMSQGMSLAVAVFFWVAYFVLVLAATRIRVELGAPATELTRVGPDWMLVTALGTEPVGGRNLTVMKCFTWMYGAHYSHPQQHAMEGLKLAKEGHIHPQSLTYAMLGAAAIGFAFLYWSVVAMFYRFGAEHNPYSGYVTYPMLSYPAPDTIELVNWLQYPFGTNWSDIGHFAAGLLLTVGLYTLRQRYISFPLHPIGFALGWSWTLFCNWLSVFLGWLAKAVLLHYGGFRVYQKAIPIFTGLLVGDFTSGWGWNIICQLLKIPIKGFP